MKIIYCWLEKYIQDDKLLVEYLYVLYHFFSLNGKKIYNYIEQISYVNEQLWEILKFFKEKKYDKKDIYELLIFSIKQTWYNIFEVKLWKWLDDIKIWEKWEKIVENTINDAWIYIKSADSKIYKRFALDDVKKVLWI